MNRFPPALSYELFYPRSIEEFSRQWWIEVHSGNLGPAFRSQKKKALAALSFVFKSPCNFTSHSLKFHMEKVFLLNNATMIQNELLNLDFRECMW